MKKYWYWLALIGFDADNIEESVDLFLKRTGGAEGVSLLLYSVDFVLSFKPGDEDVLSPGVCSYAGHPSNGERQIQAWKKSQLKKLVSVLKARGIKVLLCVFNLYAYNVNGQEILEGFGAEYPEMNETSNDGRTYPIISMIKTFGNGTCGDYFIEKLLLAVDYYGFDGVQIADGLSSARQPIERADFSDNLVSLFVAHGGKLPDGVREKVGNDEKQLSYRAKKIIKDIRLDWMEFVSGRWTEFLNKLLAALKEKGKYVLFNTTWTRDPAEAYIRYGTDYSLVLNDSINALMVEENAQTMAEGGILHYGLKTGLKRRRRLAYEGYIMQLSLKALFPELSQITMCPIRDNQEQFDTLKCAYTEITKSSALRNAATVYHKGKYLPVSDNLLYTLSDAVTEKEWQDLHEIENNFALKDVRFGNGITAVFCAGNTRKETENYYKSHKLTSFEIYVRYLMGGLPIVGGCSVDDLEDADFPVIVANADLYGEKELEILEKYRAPIFTVGYGAALKEKPDIEFALGADGDLKVYGYHLGCKKFRNYGLESKIVERDEDKYFHGSFTVPLNYARIPERFFGSTARDIIRILKFPILRPGTGCKCIPVKSGDEDVFVITNDSYYYETPRIDTLRKVANCRALSKIPEYRVETHGTEFGVLVNNRGAEAVAVSYEDEEIR